MNRIRFGLVVTMILGSMFAAASLLDSLRNFGIGAAVVAAAVAAYGLIDHLEARRDNLIYFTRESVWARRDSR